MKKIFLHATFLTATFFTLFFQAQDSSYITSTVQWDLATTIAYAKQNNIQVNIVRLDERLSEQDLLLARAAQYPNLSGSATQSLTHSGNTNPVVGGFQNAIKSCGKLRSQLRMDKLSWRLPEQ